MCLSTFDFPVPAAPNTIPIMPSVSVLSQNAAVISSCTSTAKKDRESIFDFISDFAVVACDLQLILTLGNHAMILQLIKNHVMIMQ